MSRLLSPCSFGCFSGRVLDSDKIKETASTLKKKKSVVGTSLGGAVFKPLLPLQGARI